MIDKRRLQYLIGQKIKAIRESKGLEQQELAALCDIEPSNISRIEAGNTGPTVWTLYRISNSLEINIGDLFQFEDDSSES